MSLIIPALRALLKLITSAIFNNDHLLKMSYGSLIWPALTRKLLEKYDVGRQPSEEADTLDDGSALSREAQVCIEKFSYWKIETFWITFSKSK
jgi:hypothetical protein